MNHAIQEPPSPSRSVSGRNTGFPEPFNTDRNTTLAHPDADTSPNATLEAPDIALSKTNSRHSLFRHGRHHSHGKNGGHVVESLEKSGLYDNIIYADGTKDEKGAMNITKDADTVNFGAEKENRDEQGHKEEERKHGILRKLALHKV